jgi:hypothetical protein
LEIWNERRLPQGDGTMMVRRRVLTIGFGVMLVLFMSHTACNQTTPEKAEKGAAGGAWVLYDAEIDNGTGTLVKGSIKVSEVGTEKVEGKQYTWFEIEETFGGKTKITKFLARPAEALDLKKSFNFWEDVRRIIIKEGKQAREVPEVQLNKFMPSFVESNQTRKFRNATDLEPPKVTPLSEETIEVAGKSLKCAHQRIERKFVSQVNLGFIHIEDTTEMSSEVWTSDEVPLGHHLVKVVHSSTTQSVNKLKPDEAPKPPFKYRCNLVLKDFGSSGAVSAIKGEVKPMDVPVFPFLKPGAMPQKKEGS